MIAIRSFLTVTSSMTVQGKVERSQIASSFLPEPQFEVRLTTENFVMRSVPVRMEGDHMSQFTLPSPIPQASIGARFFRACGHWKKERSNVDCYGTQTSQAPSAQTTSKLTLLPLVALVVGSMIGGRCFQSAKRHVRACLAGCLTSVFSRRGAIGSARGWVTFPMRLRSSVRSPFSSPYLGRETTSNPLSAPRLHSGSSTPRFCAA